MDTRIAIIGMSAILPGGENVYESWETIREGLDMVGDIPADRLDVTAYFNPDKTVKDKIYCKRGGFIPDFDFDPRQFGMNMFQVEDADANQTLTLLKVKEALEDAKISAVSKTKRNIGCVLGIGGGQKASNEFYSRLNYVVVEKVLRKMGMPEEEVAVAVEKFKANFPEWRLDSFPGFLGNVTAGRCTNVFNLEGMNCVVDAACASSLIALKVAIDELLYGNCDQMITGATCTDNSIGMFMAFSKTPVFSTDPSLTAYDENTKGMLIGEGSVMFVLKRYADAVRDGDTIHAVVRGCASSSDGKASGIYSPTISGQEQAIRRAYARSGVDPSTVTLIEGHGTGTPVGDRIELSALANVFSSHMKGEKEKIAVGSIKSQIGHLKSCAGYAGMVKVILAMKHKVLPASINVKNPPKLMNNSRIQDSPLYINTKMRPWFTDPNVPRRAGISSFGFGGANYHAVLEEFESEHTKPYRMNKVHRTILISSKDSSSLLELLKNEVSELETSTEFQFAQFCDKYDLHQPPTISYARIGFLVSSKSNCIDTLKACIKKLEADLFAASWTLIREGAFFRKRGFDTSGRVAALFSGQGAQYNEMFSEVAQNWPQFRNSVVAMDKAAKKICGNRISEVLYPRNPYESEPERTNEAISSVMHAQQATVACSIGTYDIFKDAGFIPDFAAGHSLGEFSALYANGCISRDEIAELVCHRAKVMSNAQSSPGAMAAVIGKNAATIKPLEPEVWIANKNCSSQVVLTGNREQLHKECERLKREGFKIVPLACSDAFHSPFMKIYQKAFWREIEKAQISQIKAHPKLYSNVTAKSYPVETDPRTLLGKHMVSSVLFDEQIIQMYKDGARIFVEFGPKQTLTKLVQSILEKEEVYCFAVNTSSRANSDILMRECAVRLAVLGVPLKDFDPWGVENPFLEGRIKKKKTCLRLSAATYKSSKTLKETERIMNDGRCIGAKLKQQKISFDEEKKKSFKDEVEKVKRENMELRLKLEETQTSLNELKAEREAAKEEKTNVRNIDLELIKRHRDMIASMLGEYETAIGKKFVDRSNTERTKQSEIRIDSKSLDNSRISGESSQVYENAADTIITIMAQKTGYEPEMIEKDMELEAELGIDSIKRVEILSEVQNVLGIEAKNVDALSRTRTVGEVIQAMRSELEAYGNMSVSAQTLHKDEKVTESNHEKAAIEDKTALKNAESIVMKVLGEKTGYEIDMIEMDMELETELGIDSIKRVEILSEVQSLLKVEAQNVDALSRTRTVGEVVDAMKRELCSARRVLDEPMVEPSPVQSKEKSEIFDKAKETERVIMEVLAEKTGYEAEMIEFDMDLETELGIDSIKRVEILSEVQSILSIEAKDVDSLSRTKTVRDVIEAMKIELATDSKSGKINNVPTQQDLESKSVKNASSIVIKVLASKTGYDVDMIENDMELETELGIDSIKRVEILSEVQAILNVEAKDVDALSRTKTVGEVIDAIENELMTSSEHRDRGNPDTVQEQYLEIEKQSFAGNAKSPEDTVLKVLAEKTGYEIDMIEPDMELETELGIDSIKRVEILSEVQSILEIEAKDVDALSRTRTVGDVIDALRKEIPCSSEIVSSSATMMGVDACVRATEDKQLAEAKSVVIKVLADKTGYEEDMIESDMDLETELGIDSIKRVEILSEVQSILNVDAKDVDALSRTKTVGEVIAAIETELAANEGMNKTDTDEIEVTVKTEQSNDSGNLEAATSIVVEVIAAKTGYEPDMIENDMELETELGIDSIKRVEILSEVQSRLNIEAKDVDALSRTKTVGEVIVQLNTEFKDVNKEPAVSSTAVLATDSISKKQPVIDDGVLGKAETVVLEVLAAKTGYEAEMIEMDMELETELGIDSIKRVEILSEVQSLLSVEAQDVDALSRTKTVGEVIDAMKSELKSNRIDSNIAHTNQAIERSKIDSNSSRTVNGTLSANAKSVVIEILAAKTGYEPDMIEDDMDLETELGIDSIKRVEILSEVQNTLGIEAKDIDALSRTKTVGEVIQAMKNELFILPKTKKNTHEKLEADSQSELKKSDSFSKAQVIVFQVLAEKTGYDVEMIEYDMELESELGIDSIKRVEILSEVQGQLQIDVKDVDALSRTRTVGEVIEAMKKEISLLNVGQAVIDADKSFTPIELRAVGCEELDLSFPVIYPVGNPILSAQQKKHNLLICCSQDDLVKEIDKHHKVFRINKSAQEEELEKQLAQIESVNAVLYIYEDSDDILTALAFAKQMRRKFKKEIVSFYSIVLGDGSLGYSGKGDIKSLEKYALAGLMKTAGLEWEDIKCRFIDISSDIPTSDIARLIDLELRDVNRNMREIGYTSVDQRITVKAKSLTSSSPLKSINQEDSWIVTGGARGITPLCIKELAKQTGGGTYYLIGRSKLEDEPAWAQEVQDKDLQKAAIKFIKDTGEKPRPAILRKMVNKVLGAREVRKNLKAIAEFGKVEYISCDVTSNDAVRKELGCLKGITGIFHASGVLRDKLIEQKNLEDFQLVWQTKVSGFENIWRNVDHNKIKHVVLFSSLAGFHGNVGQSDYSMANEVLNKIAHTLREQSISAKAFDFGPWDGGMVSPALKKAFQEKGVQIIDREGGAESVARMIRGSEPSQILVGNWGMPPVRAKDKKNVMWTTISPKEYFKHHAIKGKQIYPFTFAIMKILESVSGLYPGYSVISVRDCSLFRGISIDNEVKCEITSEELGEINGKLEIKATMKTEIGSKFSPAYRARIVLSSTRRHEKVAPVYELEGENYSKDQIYSKFLFHGTEFQGVLSAVAAGTKLKATCCIPNESELPTNSFALDLVYQVGLLLAFHSRGIASLPSNSEAIYLYEDIDQGQNFTIQIEKRGANQGDAVWKLDFSITNEKGKVYADGNISITLNDTLQY